MRQLRFHMPFDEFDLHIADRQRGLEHDTGQITAAGRYVRNAQTARQLDGIVQLYSTVGYQQRIENHCCNPNAANISTCRRKLIVDHQFMSSASQNDIRRKSDPQVFETHPVYHARHPRNIEHDPRFDRGGKRHPADRFHLIRNIGADLHIAPARNRCGGQFAGSGRSRTGRRQHARSEIRPDFRQCERVSPESHRSDPRYIHLHVVTFEQRIGAVRHNRKVIFIGTYQLFERNLLGLPDRNRQLFASDTDT